MDFQKEIELLSGIRLREKSQASRIIRQELQPGVLFLLHRQKIHLDIPCNSTGWMGWSVVNQRRPGRPRWCSWNLGKSAWNCYWASQSRQCWWTRGLCPVGLRKKCFASPWRERSSPSRFHSLALGNSSTPRRNNPGNKHCCWSWSWQSASSWWVEWDDRRAGSRKCRWCTENLLKKVNEKK